MAVYHLIWDLAAFGFLPPGAPFTESMRLASNGIASTFLALVGFSLTLAHRGGMRKRAFLRRLVMIALAAILTSAVTFAVEPQAPIIFGILACIAVSSALAAPLMYLPPSAACLLGGAALLAPSLFRSDLFDSPIVLWIGLGLHEPVTVDWRPLLPWAGVVWLAFGATRLLSDDFYGSRLMRCGPRDRFTQAMAWLGRHSLAVYLAHQPILFALAFLASLLTGAGAARERASFLAACNPACMESGGTIEACVRSCACVADKSIRADVLSRLMARLWSEQKNFASTAAACAVDVR